MPLKLTPASGGLGWAWFTPAWAATARPTISAITAIVRTAVIHSRTGRVIATSFTRSFPCSGIIGWFEAVAAADGYRSGTSSSPAPIGAEDRGLDRLRGRPVWAGSPAAGRWR